MRYPNSKKKNKFLLILKDYLILNYFHIVYLYDQDLTIADLYCFTSTRDKD